MENISQEAVCYLFEKVKQYCLERYITKIDRIEIDSDGEITGIQTSYHPNLDDERLTIYDYSELSKTSDVLIEERKLEEQERIKKEAERKERAERERQEKEKLQRKKQYEELKKEFGS